MADDAEGAANGRGRHKVFLGYAVGVGKTYEMLDEAHRRARRGQDVVVGMALSHERPDIQRLACDLETIPTLAVEYRGVRVDVLDVDAIVARRPYMVLVDELAYMNPSDWRFRKRWQEVEHLLDEGVHVLSTLNVQHLESLNDRVREIVGSAVQETVPDRVLMEAEEVSLVDLTPRALINRMKRGAILPENLAQIALDTWFNEGNLSALRELTLREIARRVELDVEAHRRSLPHDPGWTTAERIMVCLAGSRPSAWMLRRAWRQAHGLAGEVYAVYVEATPPTAKVRANLEADRALAESMDIPVTTLRGDVASELARFAREKNVSQIVLGHSRRARLRELAHGTLVAQLSRLVPHVDILIVPGDGDAAKRPS